MANDNETEPSVARWLAQLGGTVAGMAALVLLAIALRVFPALAAGAPETRAVSDQVMMWGFISAAASAGLSAATPATASGIVTPSRASPAPAPANNATKPSSRNGRRHHAGRRSGMT